MTSTSAAEIESSVCGCDAIDTLASAERMACDDNTDMVGLLGRMITAAFTAGRDRHSAVNCHKSTVQRRLIPRERRKFDTSTAAPRLRRRRQAGTNRATHST